MSADPETFYIIWNPDGPHAPRERHSSPLIAEGEAKRLAVEHPGQTFFVMQATMSACSPERVKVVHFDTDSIPF